MKDKNRIFEESKKVSEIKIVCKEYIYGDKSAGVICGKV